VNIRNVSNPAQVLAKDKIEDEKQSLKSGQTANRDPNGQQAYNDEDSYEPLSDQDVEKVLKMIREHPGIIANGLKAEIDVHEKAKFIIIYGPNQEVIKRINEQAMAHYLKAGSNESFALVSKTA